MIRSKTLIFAANLLGFSAFFWPFLFPHIPGTIFQRSYFAALLAILAIIIVVVEISEQMLDSKSVAIIGVLAALIAALRLLGAGAIGIEPLWFLLILSSRALGARLGYPLALISFATSAIVTGGIGPWLAFQMFAAGWIALGVSLIPRPWRTRREIFALAIYGSVASLLFGLIMDLQLWPWLTGSDSQLSFNPDLSPIANLRRFLTFHVATAMAWDIPRSIVTSSLIALAARPILNSLRRAQRRLNINVRVMEQEGLSQPAL